MARRKTIEIAKVVDTCNNALLHTPDTHKKERQGIIFIVETIMHSTNTYSGYRYLGPQDMEHSHNGTEFGITFDEHNQPIYGDETRRQYHLK